MNERTNEHIRWAFYMDKIELIAIANAADKNRHLLINIRDSLDISPTCVIHVTAPNDTKIFNIVDIVFFSFFDDRRQKQNKRQSNNSQKATVNFLNTFTRFECYMRISWGGFSCLCNTHSTIVCLCAVISTLSTVFQRNKKRKNFLENHKPLWIVTQLQSLWFEIVMGKNGNKNKIVKMYFAIDRNSQQAKISSITAFKRIQFSFLNYLLFHFIWFTHFI